MPGPLGSSSSVKSESVCSAEMAEEDAWPDMDREPEPAAESDADIALVASDVVLPTARRSTTSREARHQAVPTGATPRCELCKKQKKRCTFSNPSGKCDKCYKRGYECRIVDVVQARAYMARPRKSVPGQAESRGALQVLKCDSCRENNTTCLPDKRVLPQYHTGGFLVPISSDESESSDSDSDASIPAVLPARKRKRQEDSRADARTEIAHLQDTIACMEDEYQEIIRDMQDNHEQELGALRAKYEQAVNDLANANRKHERRLDDMIYIMKNNEKRADEIIQALKNK
ncbi:hypothetical protein DL764_008426 [Monosporascus ibericus]|uniref:Zn(2)-C6 fungal-type domain-containing protein n=1 Tax=Monosporascus ibericus TaxID=155417 RepID=A0A4Q4T0Y2_9PEZI|nr:hypothetical protein DL764_008426 [Monosporascus ibericus]